MLTSVIAFIAKLLTPIWKALGFDVAPFFDPDTTILSWDKLQHFVGIGLLTWGFAVVFPNVTAAIVAVICATIFELGQWDALRSAAVYKIGTPGYGFGLLDLAAGVAGAATTVLILALL